MPTYTKRDLIDARDNCDDPHLKKLLRFAIIRIDQLEGRLTEAQTLCKSVQRVLSNKEN